MPGIPENFPHSMNDKELEECIKGYMNAIIESEAQENTVIQNYPLVSLGQYELQKRQNNKIIQLTTGISFISLIVAIAALYIANTNSHTSERWERNQINTLQEIGNTIKDHNKILVETNIKIEKLESNNNNQLTSLNKHLIAIKKNTANK